eukprot:m.89343 g.89343  ORF g.89343 m.89343 type:complete len:325 (-) comp12892_c0_seq1:59-1033(-)
MKYGSQLQRAADASGHPEKYLDYNRLKLQVKELSLAFPLPATPPASQLQTLLLRLRVEVRRVDTVFRKDQAECKKLVRKASHDIEACKAAKEHILQLQKFAQWNYVGVEKLVKKIHRWLGVDACEPAHELLDQTAMYTSIEAAVMLSHLRRVLEPRNTPVECPICLSDDAYHACMCSCGHVFCHGCITQTQHCPVCRKAHNDTFVLLATCQAVTATRKPSQLAADSEAHENQQSSPLVAAISKMLSRTTDALIPAALTLALLPFILIVLLLGAAWSALHEVVDCVCGRKTLFMTPLKYSQYKWLAPHGIKTAPPPWCEPAVWES